jgi:hypothetical protein
MSAAAIRGEIAAEIKPVGGGRGGGAAPARRSPRGELAQAAVAAATIFRHFTARID